MLKPILALSVFHLMNIAIFNMFDFVMRCIIQRNGIFMCVLVDPLSHKLRDTIFGYVL